MSQEEFDFMTFKEKVAQRRDAEIVEARHGLKILEGRHEELTSQRYELDEQIEDLDAKIGEIYSFLGIREEDEKATVPQRDRGVLVVLRQVVGPDWEGIDFGHPQGLDAVTKEVHKIKPTAKAATIRSGLLRLVRQGTLMVVGKRGDRQWQLDVAVPVPVQEPSSEAQEGVETFDSGLESKETVEDSPVTEVAPARTHDEIVIDVCERVMKSVTKIKDGIGAQMVAWIMTESGADEAHFETAVKRLEGEGKVEIGKSLKDDVQVIRLPVDPGSKEALKRQRVGGNELFPGMDKPPHA
jgi:hypothetical protein